MTTEIQELEDRVTDGVMELESAMDDINRALSDLQGIVDDPTAIRKMLVSRLLDPFETAVSSIEDALGTIENAQDELKHIEGN
jgi:hypothetical protein